jgi:hypothetical protein
MYTISVADDSNLNESAIEAVASVIGDQWAAAVSL